MRALSEWLPHDWRQRLYIIIFEADTREGRLFDIALLIAIVLSVLTVIVSSVPAVQATASLPMAILEAWAAGAPTVMSKDCNLPVGFERGIAIECGHGASSIAEALRKAMQLDEPAWSRISSNARELARERFSSDAISQAWVDTYAALAARGTR